MSVEDPSGGLGREVVPGEGDIRASTVRLGHVILPVEAIDSIALTVKPRDVWPIIYGSILVGLIVAAGIHGINLDYRVTGSVFLIVVAIGVTAAFLWPARSALAIGTKGGRTYYVGARNREFLIRLGELLRRKIDTRDPDLTGEFSAGNNLVSAAPALAPTRAPEKIAPPLRRVD